MKHLHPRSLLLVPIVLTFGICGGFISGTVWGQVAPVVQGDDGATVVKSHPSVATPNDPVPLRLAGGEPGRERIDLEIRNGAFWLTGDPAAYVATIGEIAAQIQKLVPKANFVLDTAVRPMRIQNLQLRGVTIDSFVRALEIVSDGAVAVSQVGTAEDSFWAIRAGGRTETFENLPDGRRVEAFSLSSYIANEDFKDEAVSLALDQLAKLIGSVIEEARPKRINAAAGGGSVARGRGPGAMLDAIGGARTVQSAPAPSFQVHPGAKLLIVIGTAADIDIARTIINALPGQVNSRATVNSNSSQVPNPSASNPPRASTTSAPAVTQFLNALGGSGGGGGGGGGR